ncbi:MAG: peptide ABC transporter ATP-binding protein [Gammaproteobacteria bacterium]|nr:peptide ABC transporter ATP-binding protein [Gammaproteobacteria bacterium]RPG26704.1 MAG: ATP-binding cassette domain-containing protein [Gammaproteobacteria bacterium TMED50]|tara:strand:- start:903 stop:1889 length:987 start_codon:yes stop_codon:yes gene_type:complete
MPDDIPILDVRDLKVHFPVHKGAVFKRQIGEVKAVDGVSFTIDRGETLGLVGESGSGKTTTGQAVLQIIPPTEGDVLFEGKSINSTSGAEERDLRRVTQMIFQDPFSSLNPRMKVGNIIGEPLLVHGLMGKGQDLDQRVAELLSMVGLSPLMSDRYPHEFSGGQRQRIGIARALALKPKLIVCDEPVSALDVSIQAQIINLIEELQDELQLTYLFIAHDLSVVRHISNRIAVMYLGRIVELADRISIYRDPKHPYTKALLSAVPAPNPKLERARTQQIVKGEIPSPLKPPSGCHFHPRCPEASPKCQERTPELKEVEPGRLISCHLYE